MQKIGKFAHAARLAALFLPPVAMSLIGLVALSRRKAATAALAGKRPALRRGTQGKTARG